MISKFLLQAANGEQVVGIPGGAVGTHQVYVAFSTAPDAGTATVEYRRIGSSIWRPLTQATDISLLGGELAARIDDPVAALRVTFSGLVGGSGPILWLVDQPTPQVFGGDAAVTVQNYPELNSKMGSQFDLTLYIAALAANTWNYTHVLTGALPVAIKGRRVQFDSTGIQLIVYRNPVLIGTPGTPATPTNLNDRNPHETTLQIRGGLVAANLSSLGTIFRPPYDLLGADAPSTNTIVVSGGEEDGGAEIILAENTAYLFGVWNRAAEPTRYSSYTTWYEGLLDVPL